MKKYNHLFIFSIVLYVLLASLLAIFIQRQVVKKNNVYRVEINRILETLVDVKQVEQIDLKNYQYIQKVSFIDRASFNKQDMLNFFAINNTESIVIWPWYQEEQLVGYLKFQYEVGNIDSFTIFWLVEGTLLVLEVFIICILWYLKKHLITPFHQLRCLPQQMANGHLKGDVVVEKGKYFGEYLWQMSQLKDTLEVTKKRELELMKDKKQMLLSLSHDIKTPLNVIKLYNKALQEDMYVDLKSRQEAMQQIDNKTEEIEKYVDTIIKSTRKDLFDLQVTQGEFYLQDLIERVSSIYVEQCRLRNIECIIHKYDNRLLQGDIERSQEVIENLFENAFKYGDGTKIEISFYEEDYCQLISFYSSGNPVNDNEYNHLFDSFFRGANSKGKSGSGLGLYICHELMKKMGGTIFTKKSIDGMIFVLVFR